MYATATARIRFIRAALLRAALLGAGWALLTESVTTGWSVGVGLCLAATALSLLLTPPVPGAARALARSLLLVPRLLLETLAGGIDVARRALARRPPLAPALLEFPFPADRETEAVLLAYVVTLIPGTLAAEIDKGRLRLHVLDARQDHARHLEGWRERIAWALAPLTEGSR